MSTTETFANDSENKGGRNPIILIGSLLILVGLFVVLIFGGTFVGNDAAAFKSAESVQLPPVGGPLTLGDLANDFELQDIDGNPVRLSDQLGNPIVVNFWASWCAPCRIEMPELQALFDRHQEEGLVILALNQDETADVARDFFFDEMGLSFTNPLLDPDTAVADKYGVRNLPTTVFVSPEGEVTAIHRGPALLSQFEGYLADTLASS